MKGTIRQTETFIIDPIRDFGRTPEQIKEILETGQLQNRKEKHKLVTLGRQSSRLHGAVKHKLSEKYKNLDQVEIDILKNANSRHSYVSSYFKRFGFDVKTIDELEGIWKRREDILEYEAQIEK
jgi:hypothetical protein